MMTNHARMYSSLFLESKGSNKNTHTKKKSKMTEAPWILSHEIRQRIVRYDWWQGTTEMDFFGGILHEDKKKLKDDHVLNLLNASTNNGAFAVIDTNTIRSVDLAFCCSITDRSLFQIAQKCPNLESFAISHNDHITLSGLDAIVKNCSKLISFHVAMNRNIASISNDVEAIVPRLRNGYFQLYSSPSLSP